MNNNANGAGAILGSGVADGLNLRLSGQDAQIDEALGVSLMIRVEGEGEKQTERSAGLGAQRHGSRGWLGDICVLPQCRCPCAATGRY